jgi:DNA repair ATPase RecN
MTTKTEILNDLGMLRDEAQVQLHLLSMDARKHWHALEKELAHLEDKLSHDAEKVSESTAHTARGLTTTVKKFFKDHDIVL